MRTSFFKIFNFILVLTLPFSFFGCTNQKGDNSSVNGVVISQELPYSVQTVTLGEEVIYSILEYSAQKVTGETLPPKTKQRLKEHAKQAQSKFTQNRVAEEIYLEILEQLQTQGTDIIDEIDAYLQDGGLGLTKTKAFYISLSSLVGADYVGRMAYQICLYVYDYKYEKAFGDYQELGYPFLKEEADKWYEGRKTFIEEIGEDNFVSILQNGFAFAALFFGDALQAEELQAFSDKEILAFVKTIDVSNIQLGDNGWAWVLDKCIPQESQTDSAYFLLLAQEMRNNGDVEQVKTVMNDVVKGIGYALNRLQTQHVSYLRQQDYKAFLQAVFQTLREKEWERLERIHACALQKQAYEAIATARFGAEYTVYSENVNVYTLQQLQELVKNPNTDKDTFYEGLKGYIAGISPAFSYGMER